MILAALLAFSALAPRQEEPESQVAVVFSEADQDPNLIPRIVSEQGQGRERIWIAMHWLNSGEVQDRLQEKARAGVEVHVLLDARAGAFKNPEGSWPNLRGLADAGVQFRFFYDPPGDDQTFLLHHKYAVVDGATVVTGSFNWSDFGDQVNHDHILVLQSEEVAAQFSEAFGRLWDRTADDPRSVSPPGFVRGNRPNAALHVVGCEEIEDINFFKAQVFPEAGPLPEGIHPCDGRHR